VPPPLSVVELPLWVKKSSVPATSVPTGADITLAVMAEMETLAATVTVPRVETDTAQMTVHEVALGEIWNVLDAGLHTYVGMVARVAASVGHPAPEMVRVLPLVEK